MHNTLCCICVKEEEHVVSPKDRPSHRVRKKWKIKRKFSVTFNMRKKVTIMRKCLKSYRELNSFMQDIIFDLLLPFMDRYFSVQRSVSIVFVSFPQKRNGIVFSSGVNYLHSGRNIQSELSS